MSRPMGRGEIEAAFLSACRAELRALKPGNVHIHSAGHGMTVDTFERAAAAAAPLICNPALKVGARIFKATKASFEATGINTNLGIVLLCVPLAKAAAETDITTGLRRRLAAILSELDEEDADNAFAAIRLANPAGLGTVEKGDVTFSNPRMTLLEAMQLAQDRDRIARAYVTAFEDIFDVALPALKDAESASETPDLAVTQLHMTLLASFPDSHIARKWGSKIAAELQDEARALGRYWQTGCGHKSFSALAGFDRRLKERGLNPGTTADFVVATLFTARISERKQS